MRGHQGRWEKLMQIKSHKNFENSFGHRCIISRRHHWGVGGVTRSRHPGAVIHRGLDLIAQDIIRLRYDWSDLALRGQVPRPSDGLLDGLRPDPARLPHQGDLRRGLDHPHVMKDGPGGWRSHKIFSSFNIHIFNT